MFRQIGTYGKDVMIAVFYPLLPINQLIAAYRGVTKTMTWLNKSDIAARCDTVCKKTAHIKRRTVKLRRHLTSAAHFDQKIDHSAGLCGQVVAAGIDHMDSDRRRAEIG